jgi:hypothetical protein
VTQRDSGAPDQAGVSSPGENLIELSRAAKPTWNKNNSKLDKNQFQGGSECPLLP